MGRLREVGISEGNVLLESGARRVFAFCSHGVLSGPAAQRIADSQVLCVYYAVCTMCVLYVYYLLLTTYYLLPITHYLLPTTHSADRAGHSGHDSDV
jgi:hypothetical protein